MSKTARDAYYAAESVAVQQPYLVIGIVVALLALVIRFTPFPAGRADTRPTTHVLGGLRALAGNVRFVVAVLAQFFYVGAQVGIWSYLIRYAQGTLVGTPEKTAADYLILSLVVFMIGRFVGTGLMKVASPVKLLGAYALSNALLCAVAMVLPGPVGLCALIATSFFMSIMFPTIFALGLRNVGDDARELASSFLVMAIIGGAVLTPVMGAISGLVGIQWSMVVPLTAFGVVLVFALCNRSSITGS
jgi:FHS family L-fucose permease-like MFS transporter